MAPVSRNNADDGTDGDRRAVGITTHELPPSTLAAQLVNNISTAHRPSRYNTQEDYQRLLADIARFENTSNGGISLEAKLEHHHKLIYVVSRAVLEVLTREDPFADVQQLLTQATEALQFLTATVKETPAVLLHVAGPDANFRSGFHEPLWLWLFPRVLTLLGRDHCEPLHDKILEFFSTSFLVISKSAQHWNNASIFVYYLKECADSMSEFSYITMNCY
jgi:serine/threonine-protein kinase ATR